MKLNKVSLLAFFSIVIVGLLLTTYFYFTSSNDDTMKIESVFLLNSKTKNLERVEYEVDYNNNRGDIIKNLYSFLQSHKDESIMLNTIPKSVELLDFYLDAESVLYLNLSKEFKKLTLVEQNILKSSLVWSMTSLEFVKKTALNVQYEPLLYDSENNQVLMDRSNVIINPQFSYTKGTYKTLALYFPLEKEEHRLFTEIREVIIGEGELEERKILEELQKGPTLENGVNPIPPNTKIGEIITYDRICQIDLSSEFITNNSKNTTEQIASVYSIVNSLTDLKHIDKVQILIDSKKTGGFVSLDLSQPLEKNTTFIQ